ncbi:MAG: cell division protein FtsL [Zoogloeaceae bacterium]|jgi:cell division protein FtsL|nr:cell division protein FtsL [Zoogloeaceae bacterium]
MLRVNCFILFLLILASALGAVTAQNKARKFYKALEAEQEHARRLEVEYDQLQLELATWASHTRIEQIARGPQLRMVAPVLNLPGAAFGGGH